MTTRSGTQSTAFGHLGQRARRVLLGTTLVLIVTVAGAAFAYWTAGGSGSGSAGTGTSLPLTITPGTAAAQLYPGGQANVSMTITNANDSAVHVGSLALDTTQGTGGFAVDPGHTGCVLSALSFTTQTNGGIGWTVPAKVGGTDGSIAVTLTNALAMSTNAANACQGATFTVHLTAGS